MPKKYGIFPAGLAPLLLYCVLQWLCHVDVADSAWEGSPVPCFTVAKVKLASGEVFNGFLNGGRCTCRQARFQAAQPQLQGETRGFQASCDADGGFSAWQTLSNTGYQWQVDKQGNQISTFRQQALVLPQSRPAAAVAADRNPLVGGVNQASSVHFLRPQQFFNGRSR